MAKCKGAVATLQEHLFEWILCITADFKKHFWRFIFRLFPSPPFCFLFPHCLSMILPLSSVSIPSSLLFFYSRLPITLLKAQALYERRLACLSSRVCKYRIILKIRNIKLLKYGMLVFLTLTQVQCQRGAPLKIQMAGALFICIFYARHATK